MDLVGKHEETGDYPFLRLVTQIAVELLHREHVDRIIINSYGGHAAVYTMGGFLSPDANEIVQNTRQTRQVLKKRFLPNPLPTLSYPYLTKENLQNACADFELDAAPIPWRQLISEHPVLGKGIEPVLPHFFRVKQPELQP